MLQHFFKEFCICDVVNDKNSCSVCFICIAFAFGCYDI